METFIFIIKILGGLILFFSVMFKYHNEFRDWIKYGAKKRTDLPHIKCKNSLYRPTYLGNAFVDGNLYEVLEETKDLY